MIGWLRGRVLRRELPELLLDVAGVGYQLEVSSRTMAQMPAEGGEVDLEVLTIFRAESLQLYGFSSQVEKQIFSILLSVSGVGPKLALALQSELSPAELVHAVEVEEHKPLLAVSGVGKKTAQRLVLELKDKFSELMIQGLIGEPGPRRSSPLSDLAVDAISALENLGCRHAEAERAVTGVLADEPTLDLPSLIKGALRSLGRR